MCDEALNTSSVSLLLGEILMKTKQVINKTTGEVLKNKDNEELTDNTFEIGDEFIPMFNSVLDKPNDAVINGVKIVMHKYLIKARVRDKEGKKVLVKGSDEIFMKLTPTQAKSLNKKIKEGIEINQKLFTVYGYDTVEHGPQIGVGIKGEYQPPKTFEDFDKVKFNDAVNVEDIAEEDFSLAHD